MANKEKDENKPLSIVELLKLNRGDLEISPGHKRSLRPLNLTEIVVLLERDREAFIALYSKAVDTKTQTVNYGPVLFAAPAFAAKVIALSLGEEEIWESIRDMMPATVQLIALETIFKLSVPDPKKLGELLSEVMGLLQKLGEKQRLLQQDQTKPLPISSPTI